MGVEVARYRCVRKWEPHSSHIGPGPEALIRFRFKYKLSLPSPVFLQSTFHHPLQPPPRICTMSSILRVSAKRQFAAAAGVRAFHSPFALLGQSPLTQSPSSSSSLPPPAARHYEKQYETTAEPYTSVSGQRTYVVSEPDASDKHYQVPAGAYPTSSPYIQFARTEAPEYSKDQISSTSADLLAHPFTTRAAPQNPSGVGESAAIRHGEAPGAMGRRGGSYGGIRMNKQGTQPGTGKLGERNPQPDSSVAEKYSKAGVQGAWKMRI